MIPVLPELLPGYLVKHFKVFYASLMVTRQLLSLILRHGKNKTRFCISSPVFMSYDKAYIIILVHIITILPQYELTV